MKAKRYGQSILGLVMSVHAEEYDANRYDLVFGVKIRTSLVKTNEVEENQDRRLILIRQDMKLIVMELMDLATLTPR